MRIEGNNEVEIRDERYQTERKTTPEISENDRFYSILLCEIEKK